MKRRLYWLLPDVESARRTANDLLLARVEHRNMHFIARPGTDIGVLHEATILHTSDVRRAATLGVLLGALIGAIAGGLLAHYPHEGIDIGAGGFMVLTVFGAAFGFVASTLVGTSVPNSSLRQFTADIEQGRILAMVDVPLYRVEEIQQVLGERHPEATWRGVDPAVPAFP